MQDVPFSADFKELRQQRYYLLLTKLAMPTPPSPTKQYCQEQGKKEPP